MDNSNDEKQKEELLTFGIILSIIISLVLGFISCKIHKNIKEYLFITLITSFILYLIIISVYKNNYTIKSFLLIYFAGLTGWIIGRRFRSLTIF